MHWKEGWITWNSILTILRTVMACPRSCAEQVSHDTPSEIELIKNYCSRTGVNMAVSEVVTKGGQGGIDLAGAVLDALHHENNFCPVYDLEASIEEK